MEAFINAVAPIAIGIFIIGTGLRLGRWLIAATTRRRPRGLTRQFEGGVQPVGLLQSIKMVLVNPVTHFSGRANKPWARGYLLYHIAIITEVIGYSMAGLIVLFHVAMRNPVPDVASHAAESYNYSPANLLAIIFGNGEHLQSTFLFGNFAQLFVTVTWVAVLCAVAGNLHLLYTAIRKRNGAVLAGIDDASSEMRTRGWLMWDRVVVRLMIFTIIWTELLARLHVVEGIVFVHAFLGLMLMTLLPFTYLFHIVYNFLAVFYAVRRRRSRAVA
jgi:nitrate reductase gamma subunit